MGLASRIGTYMGPFQGFGPNWDQVPNLGHHYEHCSCYLDFFFSETKFSETETETFFRDQFFSKPKPRLFFRNQIFRNRNRNPQRFGKSFETEKFRNRNVNLWWTQKTTDTINSASGISRNFFNPLWCRSLETPAPNTAPPFPMTICSHPSISRRGYAHRKQPNI